MLFYKQHFYKQRQVKIWFKIVILGIKRKIEKKELKGK